MPAKKREGLEKIVGINIRKIREKRGLSQADLAREVDATQSAVSMIESGDRGTSMGMLLRIAKALEVQARDLFKEPKL